ncbi:MAG: hypothetical protein LBL47_03390 [Lactobacillus sp.]|jgi:inhibitor of KinA sporulation pathway (predicted exonuclease)|nr:hypothetical protein [Lactobacillus sp.]
MAFVVFDTEFLADYGLFEPGFDGWKNREVVQIAAIKVSDNLDVMEELNIYIKPKLHARLSDYFINLTGLTDKLINKEGISFPQAYERFSSFVGDLDCYSHSWGAPSCSDIGDGKVMAETISYYDISDTGSLRYKNIAPWFRSSYDGRGINIKEQASGDIARLLGQEDTLKALGLNNHNALYDVYSILSGLRFLNFKPSSGIT